MAVKALHYIFRFPDTEWVMVMVMVIVSNSFQFHSGTLVALV